MGRNISVKDNLVHYKGAILVTSLKPAAVLWVVRSDCQSDSCSRLTRPRSRYATSTTCPLLALSSGLQQTIYCKIHLDAFSEALRRCFAVFRSNRAGI